MDSGPHSASCNEIPVLQLPPNKRNRLPGWPGPADTPVAGAQAAQPVGLLPSGPQPAKLPPPNNPANVILGKPPHLSGALHSFKKLWRNMKNPGRRDVLDNVKGTAWKVPWLQSQSCCTFIRERGTLSNPDSTQDVNPELEMCLGPQEKHAEGLPGVSCFPSGWRSTHTRPRAGSRRLRSVPAALGARADGPGCRRGLLRSFCNSFLLREGDGKKAFVSRPAAFDHLMSTGGQSGLRLLRPDKGTPTARGRAAGPRTKPWWLLAGKARERAPRWPRGHPAL